MWHSRHNNLRMLKTASVLTRPPLRAKTRISPSKAAAREEARRTLWHVESLSDVTCLREAASAKVGNAAGGLFQHPANRLNVPAHGQR